MPFSGSRVQLIGYPVTIGLRNVFHAGPLGDVLADQTVGVFICTAFPGMIGRREIAGHRESLLNRFVAMELRAIVEGNG